MKHIINANYGDKIIINIPTRPHVVQQTITIPTQVQVSTTHQQIIQDVCEALGITHLDLVGKCRKHHLVTARFYTAYKLRQNQLALSVIGKLLHRDHTSVIHAIETYQHRITYADDKTLQIVNTIQNYEAAKNKS
jgi:chromosomal replication initiation ATPase DnaA